MAEIRKNPNGSYKVVFSNGIDKKTKKRKRIIMTYTPEGRTKKQKEADLQNFIYNTEEQIKNGFRPDVTAMSLQEFIEEEWVNSVAYTDLSLSVREYYLDTLEKKFYPYIGNMTLSEIKAYNLKKIYDDMAEKGRAQTSIKKVHSVISNVLKYAYQMDIIQEDVSKRVRLPKVKKKTSSEIQFFTPDQSKAFLNFLDEGYEITRNDHCSLRNGQTYSVSGYKASYKTSLQFKAFFYTAIYGGLRRGELLALTWEDIDFENRTIDINEAVADLKKGVVVKEPKTERSKRVVTMPEEVMEVLLQWKSEERKLSEQTGSAWEGYRWGEFNKNYVFIQTTVNYGKMMNLHTPSHKFKEILEHYNNSVENETDKLPNIRLHDLRHTSATILLGKNVDIETVSHRLGHSKPSVTLDVYGHPLPENDRKASDVLSRSIAVNE